MAAKVTLTVHGGALDGKQYCFKQPAKCVIGRAEECLIQLPSNWEFQLVSRHHCELHVDAPNVRVRDLGSRNGTYINGKLIGQRPRTESAESAVPRASPFFHLNDGDQLWVGPVLFEVKIAGAVTVPKEAVPANLNQFNEMVMAI
jgi:pSer/pThr/pTyr-binding forkhead associated (FHA) protein